MDGFATQGLGAWSGWSAGLDRIFAQERTLRGRMLALAALLREMVPAAPAAHCRLAGVEEPSSPPSIFLAPGEVRRVPTNETLELRAGFLADRGRPGELLLTLPGTTPVHGLADLEIVLGLAARILQQQFALEKGAEERRDNNDMIFAGEAALGMVHALNNHLNGMILQAAAVQLRLEEPLRTELSAIRREGLAAAARLRPLQAIDEATTSTDSSCDLGTILRELVWSDPALGNRLLIELPPRPIMLPVHPSGLHRLLAFLLRIADESHISSQPIRLDLAPAEEGVGFRLFLDGIQVPGEAPVRVVEMRLEIESPMLELRRSALHGLVRRLNGRIWVRNREGGVILSVVWQRS